MTSPGSLNPVAARHPPQYNWQWGRAHLYSLPHRPRTSDGFRLHPTGLP